MMNILIIEDEKPLADELSQIILSVAKDAIITAIIPSVEDGIEYFANVNDIDLIFSDIQLGDGLSFEIFNEIDNKVPVVFCTAFNQYALQAFEAMGIEYIVKPFSEEKVSNAINKFNLLKQPKNLPDFKVVLQSLKSLMPPASMPSIIIHKGDRMIPVSGEEIAFFYTRNNVVYAHTFQGKELVVNQTIDFFENKFVSFFYRANRQYLVNKKAIKSATQHFHRKIALVLTIPYDETILVGKEKVTHFLNWLTEN